MGLDMYLHAEKFISGSEITRDDEFRARDKLLGVKVHIKSHSGDKND